MKLIYRISDSGYNKVKPDFITNEICLKNFVEVFLPNDFTIIADNISEDTKKMILKYVPEECIQHVLSLIHISEPTRPERIWFAVLGL